MDQVREWINLLFVLVGTGSSIWSVFSFIRTCLFIRSSAEAEGRISRLDRTSTGGGTYGQYDYAPIFFFKAEDGKTYTVTSQVTSNAPNFGIGEQVRARYDPANPEDARIHTSFQTWGTTVALGVAGVVFISIGIDQLGFLHVP